MRWRTLSLLACCIFWGPASLFAAVAAVRVELPDNADPVVRNIAAILARQITSRCNASVQTAGDAPLVVQLAIEPGIGVEGYRVADGKPGAIRIVGNDNLGLLYGVGKLLRTSRFDQAGVTPGVWRGESVPKCPFRAIYASTHYMNFYEAAPAKEVQQYIEELGLWGVNALIVHFPTWQFKDFDDPAARVNLEKIRQLFHGARGVGLKIGLIVCPNQGCANAPKETLASRFPDFMNRRGFKGVNCCPSSREGHEYLVELYRRLFDEYKDVGLDYLIYGPYDEGGCGCKDCWPWGARGFPIVSRELTELARKNHPHAEAILHTWVYDTPPADEWAGLAKFVEADKSWLNYIMADAHEDFPRYPLEHGVPGNLPLTNFPEISMWGRAPWGAYGVNPLPARFERLWNQTQGKLAGGMPYSEGIYEDINKTICFQFYWSGQPAMQTVREYIAAEYSPDVVDELATAVQLMEETWRNVGPKSQKVFELVCDAEKKLTPQAKQAWRWRIFYLRALIDSERDRLGGKLEGPAIKQAFDELRQIYHAEQANSRLRPPSVE